MRRKPDSLLASRRHAASPAAPHAPAPCPSAASEAAAATAALAAATRRGSGGGGGGGFPPPSSRRRGSGGGGSGSSGARPPRSPSPPAEWCDDAHGAGRADEAEEEVSVSATAGDAGAACTAAAVLAAAHMRRAMVAAASVWDVDAPAQAPRYRLVAVLPRSRGSGGGAAAHEAAAAAAAAAAETAAAAAAEAEAEAEEEREAAEGAAREAACAEVEAADALAAATSGSPRGSFFASSSDAGGGGGGRRGSDPKVCRWRGDASDAPFGLPSGADETWRRRFGTFVATGEDDGGDGMPTGGEEEEEEAAAVAAAAASASAAPLHPASHHHRSAPSPAAAAAHRRLAAASSAAAATAAAAAALLRARPLPPKPPPLLPPLLPHHAHHHPPSAAPRLRLEWLRPPATCLVLLKPGGAPSVDAAFSAVARSLQDAGCAVFVQPSVARRLDGADDEGGAALCVWPPAAAAACRPPPPCVAIGALDLCVALGGDGTLLELSRLVGEAPCPPVLPLGAGSLCFLAPFPGESSRAAVRDALDATRPKEVMLRHRLCCVVTPRPTADARDAAPTPQRNGGDGAHARAHAQHQQEETSSPGAAAAAALLSHIYGEHADGSWQPPHLAHPPPPPPPPVPQSSAPRPRCALNEVCVEKGRDGKAVRLCVSVDGVRFCTLLCDGVLVATPTGSTAHALAAGGPLAHPGTACLLFVPLACHSLSARPVVLPATATVPIRLDERSTSPAWVTYDGGARAELRPGDTLTVTQSRWPLPTLCAVDAGSDWFASVASNLRFGDRRV